MTWLRLALANLSLSPLTSAVNVVLMALGTGSIVLLLLAGSQFSETMSRDARSIDLVLGPKGSPVQLVLSAVYHADLPPGNIQLSDAQRWADDPRIETAVPVSLGDSHRGFRIVGTTQAYASLYGAELASGRFWQETMEAVVGAAAAHADGLEIGSSFAGAHGLQEGSLNHESHPYRVVGILEPTGTVIDRLILTSLSSVWAVHGEENAHENPHQEPEVDNHSDPHEHDAHSHEDAEDLEITAMLLTYRSPIAALSLPREINAGGSLQAAAPAMEIARILGLVGIGLDGLTAFAWVLILTAAMSVFAALYGSLRSRRNDLAILRCLGATRWELLVALLLEGLLLSTAGVALGFVLGHGAAELLGTWLGNSRGIELTGLTWIAAESRLIFGLLSVGAVAAAIPAVQAYRTDVARTLAEG
ncbi:MAG: ABC transporter permease [Pseudomonadota bacterium]